MSWRDCGNEDCEYYRHEILVRDDGKIIGEVTQFIEDDECYAVGQWGKYGAMQDFDTAKRKVEEMEHPQ